MRPDGKSREILGIDQAVNDLFSSRRRTITPKAQEFVAAFGAATAGSRPRWSSTGCTGRPRCAPGRASPTTGKRWSSGWSGGRPRSSAELSIGLDKVAADVLALANQDRWRRRFDPDAVMQMALADVQAKKASWTKADLARAIDDALPDYLGGLNGSRCRGVDRRAHPASDRAASVSMSPDGPAAESLPAELRLADGRSVYERAGERLYATEDAPALRTRAARGRRRAHRGPASRPSWRPRSSTSSRESGIELGVDQAAAVRGVLASGANLESLVGPAGTGKSFVVGTLAHAWTDPALWGGEQHRVFGLATARSPAGPHQRRSDRPQHRPVARRPATTRRRPRVRRRRGLAPDPGDLVVVDESAMTDTADLAAVHDITQQAGAKLLLTGDHRQLAAVGAAGGMDLVARISPAYELTEARRFTHPWERDASLRLREGDQTALQAYRKHGRIIDGGPIERTTRLAAEAWLADTLAGQHSLLIVDTNEQAAQLCRPRPQPNWSAWAGSRRPACRSGCRTPIAGVGDVVQGRRNGWELRGYAGNRRCPINREQYRVLETRDDGGLVVAPILGRTADGRAARRAHHPARRNTWPRISRSATPPPCTPPKASPWTPPTPWPPRAPASKRSTSRISRGRDRTPSTSTPSSCPTTRPPAP